MCEFRTDFVPADNVFATAKQSTEAQSPTGNWSPLSRGNITLLPWSRQAWVVSSPTALSLFAQPLSGPLDTRLQPRFRLQKLTPGLPPNKVKKPIIFYLNPSTPEPVRSALLEGGNGANIRPVVCRWRSCRAELRPIVRSGQVQPFSMAARKRCKSTGVGQTLDALYRSSWGAGSASLVQQQANGVVLDAVLLTLDGGKLHSPVAAIVRGKLRKWQGLLAERSFNGQDRALREESGERIRRSR